MKMLIAAVMFTLEAAFTQTCVDPPTTGFARQTLIATGVAKQPVEMAVTKDGRVFVAERAGIIRAYTPSNGQNAVAATLSVYLFTGSPNNDVGGVLGLAVSPNFATDNWLYVYYAPLSLWNGAAANHRVGRLTYRLSRFQVLSNNTLNLSSEQILLSVPSIWETHNGGSLHFGKNTDLYLSIGDNDCAGCSNQYSPMDERPDSSFSDDQRSTANTNSLLGKVLRIHPVQDSISGRLYTIPAGNLFTEGKDSTLPEIYTMGHRNPYRIFPDPITGRLYIGEFGPANTTANSARGPIGADQLKITDSAAFLGYPYFLKDNRAYCHWDYATGACKAIQGQTSMYFDPARPVNTSPNNTGLRILPPAHPAVAWDNEATDNTSPNPVNTDLSGCGMGGGPVYHYDPLLNSSVKFPPYFENKWIIYAIFGSWQPKLLTIPSGPVTRLSQSVAMPWTTAQVPNFSSGGIQDMEFGDGDGALYVLDYGATQYANNTTAALYRVTYGGCLPTSLVDASGRNLFPTAPAWRMPGQMVVVPDGSNTVAAFNLSGKRIWEKSVQPRIQREILLPASLGSGPLLLRFY